MITKFAKARYAAGYATQEIFAEAIAKAGFKLSVSAIRNIERGSLRRLPRQETVHVLSLMLGVSQQTIIEWCYELLNS